MLPLLITLCMAIVPSHATSPRKANATATHLEVYSTPLLNIYTPQGSFAVHHVCGQMPSPQNDSVLACCSAAFTGQLLTEFKHSNVAGTHVNQGQLHKGFKGGYNTGCFAYFADTHTWHFGMGDSRQALLRQAANHGGCGFEQAMIIYNGKRQNKQPQKLTSHNHYRVLAERAGQLCIIDSKDKIQYSTFLNALQEAGVAHALYLDMGTGWNFSFFHLPGGKLHIPHSKQIPHTTNWIVFRK